MKKISLPIFSLLLFLFGCSDDDYNPNISGVWEQSYASLEDVTGKFEQRTIILDNSNKGSIIDVLYDSEDKTINDTIQVLKIGSVTFSDINDHKVMYINTESKEIAYVIHHINSTSLELIKDGKYITFSKK